MEPERDPRGTFVSGFISGPIQKMDTMDVDEPGTCLTRRVAILEAKLDSANHILKLVVEALQNPNNKQMISTVVKALMRERLGFLF